MRTQERRLKDLEAKAGTGTEGITAIITRICFPGIDETGEFHGTRIGAGATICNLPGENIEDFERRVMEMELD